METIYIVLIIIAILIGIYFLFKLGWKKLKRWVLKKLLLKKLINKSSKFFKKYPYVAVIIAIIYILSPIDLIPLNPLDDIIFTIIIIWLGLRKK